MSVPGTVSWAAFLRAVNVGKHNRVRIADVRDAIAALGYGDVRTYLPTGNVALTATDDATSVAARIEEAMVVLGSATSTSWCGAAGSCSHSMAPSSSSTPATSSAAW